MAGLHIKVKCKDIDEYALGGVQKIEFEHNDLGDGANWDYIKTTIFDTRKYSYENVEYIKVYGGAVATSDDELQYILMFAKETDFFFEVAQKQLRSLWTAYCLHKGYECDTLQYDTNLNWVWGELLQNSSCSWRDDEDEGVVGFDLFDDYMCEEVV